MIFSLLTKTFVKTYYRQNAGFFVFVYTMMFGIVGSLDGFSEIHFHYALISGLLSNTIAFLLTLTLWMLYAEKCLTYFLTHLQSPDHSFLYILAQLQGRKIYRLMLWVQVLLFLPVLAYAIAVIAVAIYNGLYIKAVMVLMYNLLLCFISAGYYRYYIQHPGRDPLSFLKRMPRIIKSTGYWIFQLRYFSVKHKLLLAGIKLYDCLMLYLLCRNLSASDYDLRTPFLFYCFGLLGHGVLIHKVREMEESRMIFYRGLPVSLFSRFMQYAMVYFILVIPEMITTVSLAPVYLHYPDAGIFIICSYSIILFLNSILFIQSFKIRDYLKIILLIFFVLYFFVLANAILWLSVLFLLAGLYIFFTRYYKYITE